MLQAKQIAVALVVLSQQVTNPWLLTKKGRKEPFLSVLKTMKLSQSCPMALLHGDASGLRQGRHLGPSRNEYSWCKGASVGATDLLDLPLCSCHTGPKCRGYFGDNGRSEGRCLGGLYTPQGLCYCSSPGSDGCMGTDGLPMPPCQMP